MRLRTFRRDLRGPTGGYGGFSAGRERIKRSNALNVFCARNQVRQGLTDTLEHRVQSRQPKSSCDGGQMKLKLK